jgi:hypothetical protein
MPVAGSVVVPQAVEVREDRQAISPGRGMCVFAAVSAFLTWVASAALPPPSEFAPVAVTTIASVALE